MEGTSELSELIQDLWPREPPTVTQNLRGLVHPPAQAGHKPWSGLPSPLDLATERFCNLDTKTRLHNTKHIIDKVTWMNSECYDDLSIYFVSVQEKVLLWNFEIVSACATSSDWFICVGCELLCVRTWRDDLSCRRTNGAAVTNCEQYSA